MSDAIQININILGYQEQEEWIALALEMDLRGYGASFEDALSDLEELISMQISFAVFKDNLESIFFPAEKKYWDMLSEAKIYAMKSMLSDETQTDSRYRFSGMLLPPAHVIKELSKQHYIKA